MIQGMITTRDVLLHTPTIIQGFGVRAYLRCFFSLLRRRCTTFLNCICRL